MAQGVKDQEAPLLANSNLPEPVKKNSVQKAVNQTCQSSAHLAYSLPTGSVLAFQLLSPIMSNQGECDPVSQGLTAALIAFCGLSCFLMRFTDSFEDQDGKTTYGFATPNGLWVIDGSTTLPPHMAAKYKLRFVDFLHGFMSLLVFAAVTLLDHNVTSCFFPTQSQGTKKLLEALPIGFGVLCSTIIVVFPAKRHGIGFPATKEPQRH